MCVMSTEKISSIKVDNLPSLAAPEKSEEISPSGRVDINILLNRARKVKEKEATTNLVFIGLIVSLVFVFGIILSF
jgi:hypothetical protein